MIADINLTQAQAAADADRYKADMVAWKEKEGAAAAAKEEPAAAE